MYRNCIDKIKYKPQYGRAHRMETQTANKYEKLCKLTGYQENMN